MPYTLGGYCPIPKLISFELLRGKGGFEPLGRYAYRATIASFSRIERLPCHAFPVLFTFRSLPEPTGPVKSGLDLYRTGHVERPLDDVAVRGHDKRLLVNAVTRVTRVAGEVQELRTLPTVGEVVTVGEGPAGLLVLVHDCSLTQGADRTQPNRPIISLCETVSLFERMFEPPGGKSSKTLDLLG